MVHSEITVDKICPQRSSKRQVQNIGHNSHGALLIVLAIRKNLKHSLKLTLGLIRSKEKVTIGKRLGLFLCWENNDL